MDAAIQTATARQPILRSRDCRDAVWSRTQPWGVCIRKVGKETSMYAILLASLANGIDKNVPWDDTESSSFLGCD